MLVFPRKDATAISYLILFCFIPYLESLRCFALLSVCEMRNKITFGSNSRAIDNNQQNKSGFDRGRDVIRLAKKEKFFLDAVKMQNQVVAKRKKINKTLARVADNPNRSKIWQRDASLQNCVSTFWGQQGS